MLSLLTIKWNLTGRNISYRKLMIIAAFIRLDAWNEPVVVDTKTNIETGNEAKHT